jgi:transposase
MIAHLILYKQFTDASSYVIFLLIAHIEKIFMAKYSTDFKIKIVKEYQEGFISLKDLAHKYGMPDDALIREWLLQADKHGLDSLRVTHKRKKYSLDFKLAVVNYVKTHEVGTRKVAAHFGISPSQAYNWTKKFDKYGAAELRGRPLGRSANMIKSKKNKPARTLKPSTEEKYKEEIIKLKAQLYQAEMDRDILKALTTLRRDQSKH